jgi:hypothetical protein
LRAGDDSTDYLNSSESSPSEASDEDGDDDDESLYVPSLP